MHWRNVAPHDFRPPNFNETANYPTAIVTSVMDGIQGQGAQFALATGDYLFAYDDSATAAEAQLWQLTPEQLTQLTAKNPFERFADGRPKVPDVLLEKLRGRRRA